MVAPQRRQDGGQPQQRSRLSVGDYYDHANNLRPELLDQEAQEWAKALSRVSSTQLRRFYEHVLSLDRQLQLDATGGDSREVAFQGLRADLKMLKAKVHYAFGRPNSQVTKELLEFINGHVNVAAKSVEQFDAFVKHFQAVVAFHKYHEKERGR